MKANSVKLKMVQRITTVSKPGQALVQEIEMTPRAKAGLRVTRAKFEAAFGIDRPTPQTTS